MFVVELSGLLDQPYLARTLDNFYWMQPLRAHRRTDLSRLASGQIQRVSEIPCWGYVTLLVRCHAPVPCEHYGVAPRLTSSDRSITSRTGRHAALGRLAHPLKMFVDCC